MRGAMALLKITYDEVEKETGVGRSSLSVLAGTSKGRVGFQTMRKVRTWFENEGVIFFSCETLWRDGVALKDLPRRVYVPQM
jgi:hypothetical protein